VRAIVITPVVLGAICGAVSPIHAQQSDDCKLCREDYRACKQAHSESACRSNYDICMKHCRRK
jgi:hypothetical protein